MRYNKTQKAEFLERPNRFVAKVKRNGEVLTVHVKNTGRCRELLVPGAPVILSEADNPERKTKYDLVAVYKENGKLINIDSRAPNAVAKEWFEKQGFDKIRPEFSFGQSRLDFYLEKDGIRYLREIKGCTLELDGIGYFPDAPTQRGVRHLEELIDAAREGFESRISFVIQMDGVEEVRPNVQTHPEFGQVLAEARACGVEESFLLCHVEENFLCVTEEKLV